MSDVLFSPPPHHAESTENVAFKEEHRHLHLCREVRGTSTGTPREKENDGGRTRREKRHTEKNSVLLGISGSLPGQRTSFRPCRSTRNKAEYALSRPLENILKKMCDCTFFLLANAQTRVKIQSVTLNAADNFRSIPSVTSESALSRSASVSLLKLAGWAIFFIGVTI